MPAEPPVRSRGRTQPTDGPRAARAIRVLVVDDHAVIRDGIRRLLHPLDDIEWAGEAVDGAEAIRQIIETSPDVVLMDLSMPILDGIGATTQIARDHPHVRVLVLTGATDPIRTGAALAAGALGILDKDGDPRTLLDGIRRAVHGIAPRVSPAPTPVAGPGRRGPHPERSAPHFGD